MKKSRGIKTALIPISIVTLLCFIGWGSLFTLLIVSNMAGNFFSIHFNNLGKIFTFADANIVYSYSAVSVMGVAFALVVLAMVFGIVKKRKLCILPIIALILCAFPVVEALANFNGDPAQFGYLASLKTSKFVDLIMGYSIISLAGCAFVLAIVIWILSFIHIVSCSNLKQEQPVEDSDNVVASKEPEHLASDPVSYEEVTPEPVPAFSPEPEPVPEVIVEAPKEEPVPEPIEEPVPEEEPAQEAKDTSVSKEDILNEVRDALRELVRDVVRDEIARSTLAQPSNNHRSETITGATFGGPLVVQYFNGGINGGQPMTVPAPQQQPAPQPVPQPEPVKEEPKVEQPAPVAEPAPAPVVVKPVPAPVVEKKPEEPKAPIIRIPFEERLVSADKEMKDNYNEIKNEILSYGVKSRVSNSGDTFRLHRKTYVKLTIAGKSLKLYFALDPKDYADGTIPVQDASNKGIYAEIPLVFKVKSGLSMRRCKQLIADVMEKDSLEQGTVEKVNWVKEIQAELKSGKKSSSKEDED